jgi:transposase-like protein
MASRKQTRANGQPNGGASAPAAKSETEKPAATAVSPKQSLKKRAARRATPRRRGAATSKRIAPVARTKATAKSPMRNPARPRRYTPAERAKILAAAKREGLSGPKAAKKFGISQLTFYTWRRKAVGTTRGRRPVGRPRAGTGSITGNIAEQIRREIRARVSKLLPGIVRVEIDAVLGGTRSRR